MKRITDLLSELELASDDTLKLHILLNIKEAVFNKLLYTDKGYVLRAYDINNKEVEFNIKDYSNLRQSSELINKLIESKVENKDISYEEALLKSDYRCLKVNNRIYHNIPNDIAIYLSKSNHSDWLYSILERPSIKMNYANMVKLFNIALDKEDSIMKKYSIILDNTKYSEMGVVLGYLDDTANRIKLKDLVKWKSNNVFEYNDAVLDCTTYNYNLANYISRRIQQMPIEKCTKLGKEEAKIYKLKYFGKIDMNLNELRLEVLKSRLNDREKEEKFLQTKLGLNEDSGEKYLKNKLEFMHHIIRMKMKEEEKNNSQIID